MDYSPSKASSSASAPAIQQQSRLPPNTVSRKAPRKATVPVPALSDPSRVTKPKSRAKDKDIKKLRLTNTLEQAMSSSMAQKSAKEAAPPAGLFDQKPLLPADSYEAFIQESKKCETTGINTVAGYSSSEKVYIFGTPSAATTTQTTAQPTNSVPQPQQPQRPRPRFEYSLTPQLEKIKRAFGESNWTAYIIEIEKHELGEIDGKEFDVQQRSMFQTPSIPGLQKVIKRMVIEQMVDPEATE